MASEGENVDGVAADLHNAAEGVIEKAPEGDPAGASAFIQNVAHIVLDKSNQTADSSKAYVQNVVQKVQDYAQHAVTTASGSTANIQATVSRAVHVDGAAPTSNGSAAPASASDGGFLTSVATWCSSLCGSKNNATGDPAPRSIDFQAAAANVAQILHSTTTTTESSNASVPAEPSPEEPKPKDSE